MYLLHRREQFRMTSYSINVREIKRNQIYTENFCTNWTYTPDMINISMFDKKKIIQNFSAMVRDMILFRHTVSAMPRLILILIAESGTPANFFMKPATAVITLNHQDFFLLLPLAMACGKNSTIQLLSIAETFSKLFDLIHKGKE